MSWQVLIVLLFETCRFVPRVYAHEAKPTGPTTSFECRKVSDKRHMAFADGAITRFEG